MNPLEPLNRDMLQKITLAAQEARAIQTISSFCSFAREKVLQAAKNGEERVILQISEETALYITEITREFAVIFPDCSIGWSMPSRTVHLSWF